MAMTLPSCLTMVSFSISQEILILEGMGKLGTMQIDLRPRPEGGGRF